MQPERIYWYATGRDTRRIVATFRALSWLVAAGRGAAMPIIRGRTISRADDHDITEARGDDVGEALRDATGGKGSEMFLFIDDDALK
jgi:hypothetical protein